MYFKTHIETKGVQTFACTCTSLVHRILFTTQNCSVLFSDCDRYNCVSVCVGLMSHCGTALTWWEKHSWTASWVRYSRRGCRGCAVHIPASANPALRTHSESCVLYTLELCCSLKALNVTCVAGSCVSSIWTCPAAQCRRLCWRTSCHAANGCTTSAWRDSCSRTISSGVWA